MQFCYPSKNKSRPCLFSTPLFPTSSGCVSISGVSVFIALTSALLNTMCSRLSSSLSCWQALYFVLPFMRLLTFSFSILFLCWFESLTIYFCSEVGYIFIFICTNFDFISKSKVNVCPPWIRPERQYAFFSLLSSTHLGFQIFFIFKRIDSLTSAKCCVWLVCWQLLLSSCELRFHFSSSWDTPFHYYLRHGGEVSDHVSKKVTPHGTASQLSPGRAKQ